MTFHPFQSPIAAMDQSVQDAISPSVTSTALTRTSILALLLIIAFLSWTGLHSYLLFHTLVELFSIAVAIGIFILAWNARSIIKNDYLLFLGIAYLVVATLDLEHTLAYKGMSVLGHGGNANHATQLWIAARYTESLALLAAPIFLKYKLRPYLWLFVGVFWTSLVLFVIHTGYFPDCYRDGSGLTFFKKASEFVICLFLLGAYLLLRTQRQKLGRAVYSLVAASIFFTMAAELSFTLYVDVYGLSNFLGHIFKFISFFLLYRALIETGLKVPYSLLFIDLKRNEERLRAQEREFRSMFELSAVGMAKVDPVSGRFSRVNEKYCLITGYSQEELLEMGPEDITHPDDKQEDRERFDQYRYNADKKYVGVKRYIRKDGSIIWVRVTANMIRSSEDRPLQSIGIIEDITELHREQEQLRQSEEKFRLIAQSIEDVIWMSSPGISQMMYINPAYETVWGRSCESLYQNPLSFSDAIHPEDRLSLNDLQQEHAAGKWHHNYRILRPDKSVRWIEDTGAPIYDEDGNIRLMVGVARDITLRKQLEEEQARQKKELENMVELRTAELAASVQQLKALAMQFSEIENRERRRLAEILHDDLQQLLAAANLHAGILLQKVDNQSKNRVQLLIDILEQSMRTARTFSHDLSPAILYRGSLKEIFEWMAARMKERHELQSTIKVPEELRLDSDILRVFLYRSVQEIFFNIVKHAGTKKAALTIEKASDDYLEITIEDEGRGFSPEALKNLEKKQATDGFGLYSIRERLLLLGGRLEISSAPEQGSRLVIHLPTTVTSYLILESPQAEVEKTFEADSEAFISKQCDDGQIRVLIADDHIKVRQGLASLFEGQKDITPVGFARDGKDVLPLVEKYHPHVVVMDMDMPGVGGLEATRRLRKRFPDLCVIFHSIHDGQQDIDAALAAGAKAYFVKFENPAGLVAAVRKYGADLITKPERSGDRESSTGA